MLQVKDIQEQVKPTSNAKREMKLNGIDGIEINNIRMLRLTPINYNVEINYSSQQIVAIGPMNVVCQYCKAFKFKNEAPGLCCASGQVKLTPLVSPPEPLHSLVSGNGPNSKHFLTHIQQYNNCFQMTSFGATKVIQENFMPTFKIQGQIYHPTGSLLPTPDSDSKFLQIYFMGDSERQVDQRCAHNNSVRPIGEQLQTFFHQHNELVALFTTALDRMPSDNNKIVIKADKTPGAALFIETCLHVPLKQIQAMGSPCGPFIGTFVGLDARQKYKSLWEQVATQFKWKSKVKVKAQNLKLNMERTGGGGPLPPLLPIEEKLMGIIGWTVVEGDATSELGFGNDAVLDQNSESQDPAVIIVDDPQPEPIKMPPLIIIKKSQKLSIPRSTPFISAIPSTSTMQENFVPNTTTHTDIFATPSTSGIKLIKSDQVDVSSGKENWLGKIKCEVKKPKKLAIEPIEKYYIFDENMEKNNFRATNFSAREENVLINLVKKYKNAVECKKSDTDNNRIKAEAWQKIYTEFNNILGDPHRTTKVLKNKYENIKKRAKQKFADNKKYVIGTGGGPFKDLVIADTESDLHEILGTQLTGGTSKFDGDATAESIIIQVEGNNLSDTENFEDIEESPPEKIRKIDVSHSASSCLDIYSTQVDSNQSFSAPTETKKTLTTKIQAGPKLTPDISSYFCASVEEVPHSSKSSTNDWATYTPAMLKKPLSAPLQSLDNKDVTPKKNLSANSSVPG
ncbi:unnamed protein product [Ceutorhynchus assimilis]|uniref:Regulatory protein zeste n=1 Tax=Ceutorhynchus assimilis TaxID=467358 RepID=A0A9N9MY34_9CUCU|nr:unnamed protein product [Ceutorhynchus assimilis]